ncbi:fibronectin type III domain-containing protein [Epilithonimonas arachidiradicis]|nr:fibronectin type III domain-containing protein [Epilithonimonas arachidiradicis]RKE86612.1 putative secreted protein (Por secretion system target) [Epilithonimonas arachidiradicis]
MKRLLLICMMLIYGLISAQELFPYLQAPSPSSIYVNWKTASNPESVVEYGSSPNQLSLTKTGTNKVMSDTGYPANYFYHSVKIDGLDANTKYYYRIKTGNSVSQVYSFKTLPLPGQAATADGHIRFLVLGDNQMKNVPRFDSLVSAAKRQIARKWGYDKDPADNIAMTIMVGDQVDVGTLDHYENVHFSKNKELSGFLPIQTLVGNHETYGTLGMQAYYDHYILDDVSYKGISSGSEAYYARQVGNALFLAFDTEHPSNDQIAWLDKILPLANQDSTVEWIISLGHRPYQAEQYVGDISTWIRNTVMPILNTSSKHILHIGAHHHLYHRGQLKNFPSYQIISGGVAWDQYWGMASEQDFDDVQKTISNWIYQIVDIDTVKKTFEVEAYSIGSIFEWKDNELMDSFHHVKNKPAPEKPSILNNYAGQEMELPITVESSSYQSTSDELLNSTEFLFSKTQDFSIIEKDIYRDFENLYGPVGNRTDISKDLNAGVDITKATIPSGGLTNGKYYVKVRYRDRNLQWSDWSDIKSFKIINSTVLNTQIVPDAIEYEQNKPIKISFTDTPGGAKDWIGLYKKGQNPGSATPSQTWKYTNGQVSGSMTFTSGLPNKGQYYAAIMINDGYTEIADRKPFYVGPSVSLSTDQNTYPVAGTIKLTYSNAPALSKDWVGVYKVGTTPSAVTSPKWAYVTGANGTYTFNGLPKGYYYAQYFLEDGYTAIGNKIFFQIGDDITQLMINKTIYNLNENIIATWTDSPGIVKDWLGIYHKNDNPNVDPLVSYTYFNGTANGTTEIPDDKLPTEPGSYFIVMFTDDSYNEVSNRVEFEVVGETLGINDNSSENGIQVYPNPVNSGDRTYIKAKYPIDKIDVYDMTGSLFYTSKNINNNSTSIINQSLPKGVYILKIFSNKLYTVKMIVK